ncbi:MAG: alpha/beta hydrolase [Undibacterium sp.]|nr:alpha/beta hydrolase [Undibacterium sp.]
MNSSKFCSNKASRFAAMIAIVTCIASNQSEAQTSPSSENLSKTSAVADHFQVGSLHVELRGNFSAKSVPIILIPGLSSGPYVWDDTVKQLQADHALYLVTLAGFNGKPALQGQGPMIEKAKQSLLEMITRKQIVKPILVGHSLGATLSTWFAQEHSDLIRGVFAVDGLPVFPHTENIPTEQRSQMAQGMRAQMASASQETFAAQQLQYMQTMGVIDQALAKTLAARSATSDRIAVAEYMGELLGMDIRKNLGAIKVPFAIVSPYYAPDMAAHKITEQDKAAYYGALLKGTPQLEVISINEARHFPMLDQPTIFAEKLQIFLQSLSKQ